MILVMCHGVFDMLHTGHVEHLRQAREMGDRLIVSVVPDRFVSKPGRPICTQDERLEMLLAIRHVDAAELCNAPGPQQLLIRYKPDIYARGSEYRWQEMPEYEVLRSLGVEIRYTKSIQPTTSAIIARIECAQRSS